MTARQTEIVVRTEGKGLYPVTDDVRRAIREWSVRTGLLNVYLPHTSASLLIQENADPTARRDLETFLDKLVPEGQPWHQHTAEGPDDTVSHLKAAITPTFLQIPLRDGTLALGTWQGIYLWEHRRAPHTRRILLTVLG